MRITHPFHPYRGGPFVCVGERYNRYGKRLLLQVAEETICSVSPEWTDLATPDAEIVLGGARALFRVVDLIELDRFVVRLSRGKERARSTDV